MVKKNVIMPEFKNLSGLSSDDKEYCQGIVFYLPLSLQHILFLAYCSILKIAEVPEYAEIRHYILTSVIYAII